MDSRPKLKTRLDSKFNDHKLSILVVAIWLSFFISMICIDPPELLLEGRKVYASAEVAAELSQGSFYRFHHLIKDRSGLAK